MGGGIPKDLAKQFIFPSTPHSSAFSFADIQQLVLEEINFLMPEDVAELAPVLIVGVDELGMVEHLIVHVA
jgi:hypothetical protein